MFKKKNDKKIIEFIDRYSWELSGLSYKELKMFLDDVNGFQLLIPKIDKLNEKQKIYVLSTIIDYKKFGFNHKDVELILEHKLDLIKDFKGIKKFPNLDRVYYALQPNEILYRTVIADYRKGLLLEYDNELQNGDTNLRDYVEVLSKYYKEFHNIMDEQLSTISLKKQLLFFKPKHLRIFLEFDNIYSTQDNKKRLFNYLTTTGSSMVDDIEVLNSDDFHELLMFVFSKSSQDDEGLDDYDIDAKLKLLPEIISRMNYVSEYKLDREFINNLNTLPVSFLNKLSDKKTCDENYKFVEAINKYKNPEIIDIAIKRLESFQSEKSAKMFVEFITDDFFVDSNDNRQKELLDLFADESVRMDIDESLELVGPESSAINEVLLPGETLEFINPKTKMKIIIKNKNSQNN